MSIDVNVEQTNEVSSYDVVSAYHQTHINEPKWEKFEPINKEAENVMIKGFANLPPILTVRICRKCWKR